MTAKNKKATDKKERKAGSASATGERKPNWREVYATVDDIKAFLADRILLRYNEITGRVEYRVPQGDTIAPWSIEAPIPEQSSPTRSLSGDVGRAWAPISDRIVNSIWTQLEQEKPTRVQDLYRVIESDYVPAFHPFRYYLEHLPQWNGEDHILALSVTVSVKGGVEEQLLFAEYLKKWLVGMVAAWVDPTVVNNVILVLIGEQGSYKTTWFNHLLPPELSQYFYTKTNANRMGRDDLLTLAQYGLVCCEELDTMNAKELNQLKAAVTMPSIDERAAYAHFHEHRKHIASFCGTGNNPQFLSDPTGNRRWLPFEVERITSPREYPFDYAGIYAQAYALYQQGFRYWFSRDEVLKLQKHNEDFEAPKPEQELIDTYFRKPAPNELGEFLPIARVLQTVGGVIAQRLNTIALGRAFTAMGFKRVVRNHIRGYIVVQRTAEEIKARQKLLAGTIEKVTDVTDKTDETDVF